MLARGFMGRQSPAVQELVDASIGEVVDIVNDAQLLTIDAKGRSWHRRDVRRGGALPFG